MGGRGKSSGAARRTASLPAGPPLNFGDAGAIPLEVLEARDRAREKLAAIEPRDVARGVEGMVERLLAARPGDYARRQNQTARVVEAVAAELKRRPAKEREAFAASIAPLMARLRAQAERGTS